MAIGFTIGGGVGMTAEIANHTSGFKSLEGDGEYCIDYIPLSTKTLKVRSIFVMKTDLLKYSRLFWSSHFSANHLQKCR